MAEYIDREEAICKFGEGTWAAAVLEGILAASVEPVVHCEDCKNWDWIKSYREGTCLLDARLRCEDFFCADGKRGN